MAWKPSALRAPGFHAMGVDLFSRYFFSVGELFMLVVGSLIGEKP